jgi:hypothetical protein
MKQCPTCQSQYTDDTLQFCLQDGSPLNFITDAQSKTIAFGEQETVVSNRPSGQINQPPMTNPTDWNPNHYQSNPAMPAPQKRSSATMAVFVTVFVMLLLFSVVGIGAWLYFRGVTPDDNGNLFITKSTPYPETLSNKAAPTNANTSIRTTPATTPLISSSSSNNANTTVDNEQIKSEVAQRLNSWKSASESLNLDAHMSHYAPTLDYYNRKGASAGVVRADKQRAYTLYSSIEITLSNIDVTVVPATGGERVWAVFDKEWNFSGAQKADRPRERGFVKAAVCGLHAERTTDAVEHFVSGDDAEHEVGTGCSARFRRSEYGRNDDGAGMDDRFVEQIVELEAVAGGAIAKRRRGRGRAVRRAEQRAVPLRTVRLDLRGQYARPFLVRAEEPAAE